MHSIRRNPKTFLDRLVSSVWAQAPLPVAGPGERRELVLPTGSTHVALRFHGPPILVFDDAADRRGHGVEFASVGGARARYHVRDVSAPSGSVGAMLRPGACQALLGVPESALAGHHTPLSALVGSAEVDALLERLHRCRRLEGRLSLFEDWLIGRAQGRLPVLHPALQAVLGTTPGRFDRVGDMVEASGLSHRHWIAVFRHATGLAPSEWLQLQRFEKAIGLAADPSFAWADIAAGSGFSDQAHLANVFRTIAGVTPSQWRLRHDPGAPRHVRA
ncbi:helix-turn-helix domain-containing protein [Pseudacidovorax intermedius]|uniref:AraC family transcriptional regulator n=1 Tax=Pseudacidovorax intermedius TaxID=433924 RepID=A0A147H2N3_9BURK|nr:AraC family transcriptional regulator [Pseudacidovorax intermedius]KTT24100.1 AraC family transcriptional regulator [Pseudacidovorax intermedius]